MSNPKFKVLYEKLRGKTFEINRDAMSIGRRDTMDICIKDATLSGHHADISYLSSYRPILMLSVCSFSFTGSLSAYRML